MVNREECVDIINKFIKAPKPEYERVLFNYLCDVKGITNTKDFDNISKHPALPSIIKLMLPQILEELMTSLSINKITKDNILLTVF